MVDFTISPTDPDVILVATRQGVVRSTDGGRTFAPAIGSPRLALLDWSEGDIVIGVAEVRARDHLARVAVDGRSPEPEAMTRAVDVPQSKP